MHISLLNISGFCYSILKDSTTQANYHTKAAVEVKLATGATIDLFCGRKSNTSGWFLLAYGYAAECLHPPV